MASLNMSLRQRLSGLIDDLKGERAVRKRNSAYNNVLITMPWMTFGGAETLVYNYCQEIKDELNITFMTGLPSENEWEHKFRQITSDIYHLPEVSSDPAKQLDFVSKYIKKHDVQILHIVHNGFMFAMLPTLKKRYPHLKVILTLFNDRVPEYVDGALTYEKYIDKYVSDNKTVATSIGSRLKSQKNFVVIPNGINAYQDFNPELFSRQEQRENLGLETDDIAIFFVGRLSPEKNPDVFIEAAKLSIKKNQKKNLKFFLIGDGNMKNRVQEMLTNDDSGQIQWLGYQERIAKYLAAADIFVLPSSIEGFPLSILEAMSMGVAIIASDVGAVSEIVESSVDGYVVTPGSSAEIANKIQTLASDNSLLESMKSRVREKVEKKYSNKILKQNYEKLYEGVIK